MTDAPKPTPAMQRASVQTGAVAGATIIYLGLSWIWSLWVYNTGTEAPAPPELLLQGIGTSLGAVIGWAFDKHGIPNPFGRQNQFPTKKDDT